MQHRVDAKWQLVTEYQRQQQKQTNIGARLTEVISPFVKTALQCAVNNFGNCICMETVNTMSIDNSETSTYSSYSLFSLL